MVKCQENILKKDLELESKKMKMNFKAKRKLYRQET